MQETSLLELFENALGRPRQSWHALAARPLRELDIETELDFALCPIEVAEPEPLDLVVRKAHPKPAPPLRARIVTPSLLISLGLHVMPVAALIGWSSAAPEVTAPIPVQLVVEQPPPPPAPRHEEKPPASGPLASEDIGKKASPPDTPVASPTPPPPPPATPLPAPKEPKLAAVPPQPPEPKPKPP